MTGVQTCALPISPWCSSCYVTHFPCINCTKALINAGIVRLIYSVAYRTDENAVEFLRAANIEVGQSHFKPDGEDL